MSGSGNSRAYLIGVTNITVGNSAVVELPTRAGVLSSFIEVNAVGTSGAVALVNGTSFYGDSGVAIGYVLKSNVPIELGGPAKFYLAAQNNAVTVSQVMRLSSGATLG